MSGFNLFKRGQCPICGGASSGCRQSTLTELIFCRDTSANPHGYSYRGDDTWGFGMWQHVDDAEAFSQQAREEREQRRREFLAAEERRRQQQIARQMPAVERDQWYKKLLDHLVLTEADREKLVNRGFTLEQIAGDGYRSVGKFQRVGAYPFNLPGILASGFGNSQILNVGGDGILCPIRNPDGLIIGFQVRLHDGTDGRYRWLTSATKKNPDGATPHLNGELPLGVFEPNHFEGDSLWMTEGTAIKPSLTRYRLGVPVVGAASGRFSASPEASKAAVNYLCAKYRTKTLTFAVDAGDVINCNGVPERWQQQFTFFQSLGYTCRIAWWGQVAKDEDDIDELLDYSAMTYITPESFWEIVEEHKKPEPDTPTDNTTKTNTPTPTPSDWAWQQWVKSRKFTPDIILDQEKFTFPLLPDKDIIAAIKSGLGTGKTLALIQMMKLYDHIRSMVVGYRNNLLLQTIRRAIKEGVTLYHLREDDGTALLADVYTKLLFCLDSMHLVDGYFTGVDLYIDEIVSVLLHATGGGTLGDNQAKALKILTRALQVCNRVILLDGNLSGIHADFIARLAPSKRLIKVENRRQIAPHTIKIIDGIDDEGEIKKADRSPLIQSMLDPDVKPWVFCDSKERTQILGKILSEKGKQGYVLNSETSEQEWAREFLDDADKFILKYKPDFMILSPTAESGVSVTVKDHFTDKFSFYVGVQGTNSQHQSMFRLRDETIPHYVFCPERSVVQDRSSPQTYSIKQFQKISNDRILQSGVLATQSADNSTRAAEIIGQAIARQNDCWWDFSCQIGALDNYEMLNLRKCLVHALEEAGHDVEIVQWDMNEGITAIEKKAKEEIQKGRAKEIYGAVKYDSIDDARKKARSSPSKDVLRRIEKTFLLDKLPGIDQTSVWSEEFIYQCHIKNKNFIPSIQRFWMVNNLEVSQKRHESNWFYHATREDFHSARVKNLSHDVIWALKQLDICQFIGQEYSKDSPHVTEFLEKLRSRTDIQLALRKSIKPPTATGKERLEIIGSLLSLIGYKNFGVGKKFVGGVRLMHYTAKPFFVKPEGRRSVEDDKAQFDFTAAHAAVITAIASKFTDWMASDKSRVTWEPEPAEEEIASHPPVEEKVVPLPTLQEQLIQRPTVATLQPLQVSMTEEEHGQAAELAVELPSIDDRETFDLMTGSLNRSVVVAAMRSLSKEVQSRIVSFCGDLQSLLDLHQPFLPATG